jgi:plastocyanin
MMKGIMSILLGSALALLAAAPVRAEQELTVTIKNHRFEPEELKAKAGEKIRLAVINADPTPEEFESHELNREKIIRGGQTAIIMLPALKPGTYPFFGEFNPTTAQGRLIIE